MEPMRIYVRSLSGKEIVSLNVRGSDTIEMVKAQIQTGRSGTPSTDCDELMYQGNCLRDSSTLADCRVKKDSTLDFNGCLRGMLIIVIVIRGGHILGLMVNCSDSIAFVKHLVHKGCGTPIHLQRLKFQNMQLEDNCPLFHCGIKNGSTLMCGVMTPIEVLVSIPRGPTFAFEVKTIDTIATVKAQIYLRLGTPVEKQCLTIAGIQLEDNRTVKDYDWRNVELHVVGGLEPMRISVDDAQGLTITLFVTKSDTIKELKSQISRLHDIPILQQRLICTSDRPGQELDDYSALDRPGQELADDQTLGHYGIEAEARLYLVLRYQ